MSISSPRTPSSSWPGIGFSCSAANQPGSGTDIALWVATSATRSNGRSHSSAWPLQRPAASASGSLSPPAATNVADAPATTSTATAATPTIAARRRERVRSAAGLWIIRNSETRPA